MIAMIISGFKYQNNHVRFDYSIVRVR